ncbi:MAG: tetratricopeptide repeat protein [Ignavibacteriae bacterium]|nr:tetratricopeptide repeat protein [Ignavibacteriota bacterium]
MTLQAHSIVQKYFAEQETSLNETLQRATTEQQTVIEKLQLRKGEILRILAVERKKKEERKRKAEEERKRKEEAEAKRKADDEKRRKQIEEQERKEKIRAAIERIRSHHSNAEFEDALAEVELALELEPEHSDLKIWEHRIREAQQKKLRDEEAAYHRERELASQKRKEKAKTFKLAAFAIVGVVLVFLIYYFQKDIFPQTVTLAIEPFSFTGRSSDEASLGTSLAREVSNKMLLMKNVTVMNLTSTANLKRKHSNVARAINKLGFAYVLRGSLSSTGNTYLADVQVLDSLNEEVWAGHFEKPASQLMQLPEEIVLELAKAMDVNLSDDGIKIIRRTGTANTSAYIQYLRAVELLEQSTPASIQQAYQVFEQASTLDSRYPDVTAGVAAALLTKIEKQWDRSDSVYRKTELFVQKALKLHATLPMTKISQARLASLKRKFNEAIKLLDEVLLQYPSNSDALLHKGKALLYLGKYDDALTTLNKCYEVNPRNTEVLLTLGYANAFKGKLREAMRYQEYALQIVEDSTHYLVETVGNIVMADPDLQVAMGKRIIIACERILNDHPRDLQLLYLHAQILQVLGKIPEANRPLNTMRGIIQNQLIYSPQNANLLMDLALTLTRYGSFTEGLDMARRAIPYSRKNVTVLYKLAQMYSVQMASHRGGKIDLNKKNEALKYLREAIALDYRMDELMNGDFYNLRAQPEFLSTIQLQSK